MSSKAADDEEPIGDNEEEVELELDLLAGLVEKTAEDPGAPLRRMSSAASWT